VVGDDQGAQLTVMVAIISDTHMPRGDRRLPDGCLRRLREAETIIHAGDLSTRGVLEQLRALGPPVVAVHGNVDEAALTRVLPATATVRLGARTIAVVHDAGPAQGRLARLRRRFPDADAVVFGHSHLPLHEVDADGFQIFNPGSPTERRRAPTHTMGIGGVGGDGRLAFTLVQLD
jgi:putative phosphoesterase